MVLDFSGPRILLGETMGGGEGAEGAESVTLPALVWSRYYVLELF